MHTLLKKSASVLKTGAFMLMAAGLLVSCSKERLNTGADHRSATPITDKATKHKITEQAQKLPAVGIYNKTMDKLIIFNDYPQALTNFVDL